jgi:hypothetical protein
MSTELHVALDGIATSAAGFVVPVLDIVVHRSDLPTIHDVLTPLIPITSGGAYLAPSAINAAFMSAVRSFLADPSGWNISGPFDAEYLHSGVSVAASIAVARKTADTSFSSAVLADVPAAASGAALGFQLASGRLYRFSFDAIVNSSSVLDGIGMTVSAPAYEVLAATARYPAAGVDGVASEWVGNITASNDPVISSNVTAAGVDMRFSIDGTIITAAAGMLALRAGSGLGLATVTVRRGTMGMLWDLGAI